MHPNEIDMIAALRRLTNRARKALPDSPVRPDTDGGRAARFGAARRCRVSAILGRCGERPGLVVDGHR